MLRVTIIAAIATALLAALPAVAQQGDVYPLPDGWNPEGIAKGPGKSVFVGSIPSGRVLRLDVRTGAIDEVVPQQEGRAAIGLKYHRKKLFVAGGGTGHAFVYDARSGQDVRDITLTSATPTFVNDVTIARKSAWFTESRLPQLYRVALGRRGNPTGAVQTIPFSGDIQYDANPDNVEVNGIEATPNGKTLLVVQSNTGMLFKVDARTGESTRIPLTGGDAGLLPSADGILLKGRRLYVVQNRLNKVAVVRLERKLTGGAIEREITHPEFDVPTTVARVGSSLYLPNARFGTATDQTFDVVRVPAG